MHNLCAQNVPGTDPPDFHYCSTICSGLNKKGQPCDSGGSQKVPVGRHSLAVVNPETAVDTAVETVAPSVPLQTHPDAVGSPIRLFFRPKAIYSSVDISPSPQFEPRAEATQEGACQSTAGTVTPAVRHTLDSIESARFKRSTSRRPQVVSTLRDRLRVKAWMAAEIAKDAEDIPNRALIGFPALFTAHTGLARAASLKKARRWLADVRRVDYCEKKDPAFDAQRSISRNIVGVRKRQIVKAGAGRGRKRAAWVEALYSDLAEEFHRVRRMGVKVNGRVLACMARHMINNAPESSLYHSSVIDSVSSKPIESHIVSQWVSRFCDVKGIVCRSQTGKLMTSPAKQLQIDLSIVKHLAVVKHDFDCGKLDEDLCFNMDETGFHVNMDDSKTLDWRGVVDCKYHDVTSGGQNFTLMVQISGGRRATLEPGFIVFQNAAKNYPIRGCPDNVTGVSYRTGPKGWMDSRVFAEMFNERRFIRKDPHGRRKVIFIDNVGSHKVSEEIQAVLNRLNAEIRYLPPNSTDLTQPADSFVIQAIKAAWIKRWDQYKYNQIASGEFRDADRQSGHIANPQKHYFLKLAAESLAAARERTDASGLNFARKSMIRCGLSLNEDGVWKESQLKPALQKLINAHRIFLMKYMRRKRGNLAPIYKSRKKFQTMALFIEPQKFIV